MKITESELFHHSAHSIWNILKEPGNMPAWNPKCRRCGAVGTASVGAVFQATFELGGKTRESTCEVIDVVPREKIAIRYSVETPGRGTGHVVETFLLRERGLERTQVDLTVDFSEAHLPLCAKTLMWVLSKCGYSAGKSSLDGIRELLE